MSFLILKKNTRINLNNISKFSLVFNNCVLQLHSSVMLTYKAIYMFITLLFYIN
jgi:hypothetical protein